MQLDHPQLFGRGVGLGAVAIIVTLVLPRGLSGALVDRFGLRLMPVGYTLRGLVRSMTRGPEAPGAPAEAVAAEPGS